MVVGINFQELIFNLQALGLYDFILPFLLVFAIVYGILSYMKIFGDSKPVHVIISVVLGLLSINLGFFQAFLAEIAPRLGVGLVVLLVLLILIGLFIPEGRQATLGWVLLGVGVVIFIIILSQTASVLNFGGITGGIVGSDLIAYVVLVVLLIGVIVAVVSSGGEKNKNPVVQALAPLFGGKSH